MPYSEKTIRQLVKNFDLLSDIVRSDQKIDQKVDLTVIERIINEEIPDALRDNNDYISTYTPEDFYSLYTDFRLEYAKFRDFILYDQLIGKNIIALGGGFSSGKSSFLNALMEEQVLPEAIDPSTSVPTYIVQGLENKVEGVNVFASKMELPINSIHRISHGFGSINEENEVITESVTLGHLLESIFVSTPLQKYENIAFLDTPGYSKPDSEQYSEKTDEQISKGQLNSSNYILWFVQADAGTITDADIRFIKNLNENIPKLIIVTKADKKPLEELKSIIEKIETTLELRGIQNEGVLTFSSKPDQIIDEELAAYISADRRQIKNKLQEWNHRVTSVNFAMHFKELFTKCNKFYDREIDEQERGLSTLRPVMVQISAEETYDEIYDTITEPLKFMVSEAQEKIRNLKKIEDQLQTVQNKFFTEIKSIGDAVGIPMPEPSEIDFLKEDMPDPLQMLEEFKKDKGIKTDLETANIIQKAFAGFEPEISRFEGSNEYKNELNNILRQATEIKDENIKIRMYQHSTRFGSLISSIRKSY